MQSPWAERDTEHEGLLTKFSTSDSLLIPYNAFGENIVLHVFAEKHEVVVERCRETRMPAGNQTT